MVAYGRDDRLREDLFSFLRAIGLDPLEWSQMVALTGKSSPYTGEVIDAAFRYAQAVVVLLSPDDVVRLRDDLLKPEDPDSERKLTFQPRPNVLFEAGFAFATKPERTIIVKVGKLREISDIHGRNEVRLSNDPKARQQLTDRLKIAKCAVKEIGTDWLTVGNFEVSRRAESRQEIESGTNFHHGEKLSTNQVTIAVEERDTTALVIYVFLCLFGLSWSAIWLFASAGAFGLSFLFTAIIGGAIYAGFYFRKTKVADILTWCKSNFPAVLLCTLCFVPASFALRYSISRYSALSGLTFQTHLFDTPTMCLQALLFVVAGGFVLNLPAVPLREIHKRCWNWMRSHRRVLIKTCIASSLLTLAVANVAWVDSTLVLAAPKVGVAETRYATDGVIHMSQSGLTDFGAWSQNQQIVHIITPLFPLITESSYSFMTNSSTPPSLLSASGLSVSSPIEDSQDRIVVQLTTYSTSTSSAQFTVQFYSEFDVKTLAYIYFSPRIVIQNINGTQQSEARFEVVNHSPYTLAMNNIILYSGGSTPENVSLTFYPKTSFWPNYYYNNDTRTFYFSYTVQEYGNLTAFVIYNGS